MLLGAILFLLVFIAINPQSRGFIATLWQNARVHLADWGPVSFLLILVILFAAILSVLFVMTAPKRQDPENPLARYKPGKPYDV